MSRIFEVVRSMSGQGNHITIPVPYIDFFSGDQQAHLLAGILNQLVYWTGKSHLSDGWFHKSHEELAEELHGVTAEQVRKAVAKMLSKYLGDVIEDDLRKANGTPTKHYRVNGDALIAKIFPAILETEELPNRSQKQETGSKPAELLDSEVLPNGIGDIAELERKNSQMETEALPNQSGNTSESILYTDDYTDNYKQIKNPCQLPSEADDSADPSVRVLNHFNQATNSAYRDGKTTMGFIHGRLEEDFTADDLILIVDYVAAKWLDDPKMDDYLRPKTIFSAENCDDYFQKAKKWNAAGRPEYLGGKWVARGSVENASAGEECVAAYRRFIGSSLPLKAPSQLEQLVRTEASKVGVRGMQPSFAMTAWNRIWKELAQRQGSQAA